MASEGFEQVNSGPFVSEIRKKRTATTVTRCALKASASVEQGERLGEAIGCETLPH